MQLQNVPATSFSLRKLHNLNLIVIKRHGKVNKNLPTGYEFMSHRFLKVYFVMGPRNKKYCLWLPLRQPLIAKLWVIKRNLNSNSTAAKLWLVSTQPQYVENKNAESKLRQSFSGLP
jgi:hypothetical protein